MMRSVIRIMPRERSTVNSRVREIRRQAGLSQEDLAQLAGLTRKTIWSVECAAGYAVSVPTLTKIATALQVDVADLLSEPEAVAS